MVVKAAYGHLKGKTVNVKGVGACIEGTYITGILKGHQALIAKQYIPAKKEKK